MIKISGSTITATGGNHDSQGGAGIGGGYGESLEGIYIESSTITATGGTHAAGIGSSGTDNVYTTAWNTECGTIYIEKSKITATGGSRAAGIGSGDGAQFYMTEHITVWDSEVEAQGGEYAAGIGAGANGALGSGGEAPKIAIMGKSKVTATGGKRGAGIGGGCDGGSKEIKIGLNDTQYSNGSWVYYVKATGGSGAAGIGSGGVSAEDNTMTPTGYDIDKVTVSGGYVYAQGGADDYGAGAGIGGGACGGNLNGFEVTGGYVEAHAGYASSHKADDIGTGGNDTRHFYEDENFEIYGGTVIGGLSSDPDEIIIDGGSVSHICLDEDDKPNAVRSDGTKVYRTLLKAEAAYYELQNLKTSLSGYGTTDVISDGGGTVYLYLPALGQDKSTADFKVNGTSKHYYGTTETDGNGWMKMVLKASFKEPTGENTPIAGKEFVMELNDSTLSGQTEFTVSGNVELRSDAIADSPGAAATLYGKDFGEFTIKATNAGNDMYWSATAEYTGKITKKAGTITITENPTKVFDGTEVADPNVETDSGGAVTYEYFTSSGASVSGKPKDAGTYYVVATVAETDKYTKASSERFEFTIEKCPITLSVTATESGTDAEVTISVHGAVEGYTPGEIIVAVNSNEMSVTGLSYNEASGCYKAAKTFSGVSADEYEVTAEYTADDNYECINDPLRETFDKNLVSTVVEVNPNHIETIYENGATVSISPTAKTADGQEISGATYKYEVVVSDKLQNYHIAPTVDVHETTGEVTINNAGVAIVKVTLEGTPAYNAATTYVTVTVKRKDVYVKPFAVPGNGLTEVTYGNIDGNLDYDIKYYSDSDCTNDITGKDNFVTLGVLRIVELDKTTQAGEADLKIIKDKDNDKVFLSRNYNIRTESNTVTIGKADLQIAAVNATSKYGIEPEYSYTATGLAAWDSADDVIESVGLAGGESYTGLAPGTYADKIAVTVEENPANYNITDTAADLIIERGSVDLYAEIKSKVYDGMPNEAAVAAEPVTSERITADMLETPKAEIKYFKIGSNSGQTQLASAPAEPGYYIAKAAVQEDTYYEGAETLKYFRIGKASLLVEVSSENKSYDGKPAQVTVSSTPITSDDTALGNMAAPGEAALTYYEAGDDGNPVALAAAPVNAGPYLVRAEVAESDYYEAAGGGNYFRIFRARYEINAPEVQDMLMREGLTLADQKLPERWAWVKPSMELAVGEVSAYAVYTPEDTENYFQALRKITFKVYEETSDGDGTNDGTSDGTGGGTNDGTGGSTNEGTGDGINDGTGGSTNDGTGDVTNDVETGSESTALDTGDNNLILLFVVLLMISGIAVVDVVVKKKKINKKR